MEQTKVIGIDGPEPINYTITMSAKIDYSDLIIDEDAISSPLVLRKQLAAYSHKPKGVKRLFKPQQR